MSTYITGDTHRDFNRIFDFCAENGTSCDDIMIILGDAGINYYLDQSDADLKEYLGTCPITLFCIHGNHEERPFMIDSYEETEWHGGTVYYEEAYPNLLFAKDGEIYDFDGKKAVVIGGAYSVDKFTRDIWFDTEQPTEEIKAYVEGQLERAGFQVDYVFSHTAPKQYEPTWAFTPGRDQSLVDKSTEEWLDSIERRLNYECWYCGHYHVDDQEGPVRIMYEEVDELW